MAEPLTKGPPPNNGQNVRPHRGHYSEVPATAITSHNLPPSNLYIMVAQVASFDRALVVYQNWSHECATSRAQAICKWVDIQLKYGEIVWPLYGITTHRLSRKRSLRIYFVWTNWNSFVSHQTSVSYYQHCHIVATPFTLDMVSMLSFQSSSFVLGLRGAPISPTLPTSAGSTSLAGPQYKSAINACATCTEIWGTSKFSFQYTFTVIFMQTVRIYTNFVTDLLLIL